MAGQRCQVMRVISGLEVLLEQRKDLIHRKRLGLICNQTAVDHALTHLADHLYDLSDVRLMTLMGPQHGIRGETQDNMIEWQDYVDSATGLPVYSLYSSTRKPTPRMLDGLDTVLFDIQDVGTRVYTYIYTMSLAMEACRESDVEFMVLDRPNPINGIDMEGPVLKREFSSFVGLHPLPMRHGMTVGELALYFNQEIGIGCRLRVVPMKGWRRSMFFDETGLPWVMPSPNMPTVDTALVYPGTVLFEGTSLSEGRGTTRPFEVTGAPWIDPRQLTRSLREFDLPGTRFRPVYAIPTFHKWSGEMIGGVQIHVTERRIFQPFRTALALLRSYREAAPQRFDWRPPPYEYEAEKLPFDILCGTDRVRAWLESTSDLSTGEAIWASELEAFRQVRKKYLLYE